MDNNKILDCLKELVKRRNQEQIQNQEFDGWSETEDCYWQDRTDEINKMIAELESKRVKDQKDDYKTQYLYLAAEFENYKKRIAKSESYAHDKAFEDVILHFLSLYDDMERLYKEVQERASYDSDDNVEIDIGPVDTGFELIFENFENTLQSLGCKKIEVGYGDKFDVNTMEAISSRDIKPDEGYDSDEVVEIFQSGWKYKDKTIRPTKVVVSK